MPRNRTTATILGRFAVACLLVGVAPFGRAAWARAEADLILHHGKIVTADRDFSIHEALAVKGDQLLQIGSNQDVLRSRGPNTALVDLGGKMVLPGLIDSHTHPTDACMIEFDHPVPEMETIADVLSYIHTRAMALGPGGGSSSARSLSRDSRNSATRHATSSTKPHPITPFCSRLAPTPRSTRWR